jgi:hypothetical protein
VEGLNERFLFLFSMQSFDSVILSSSFGLLFLYFYIFERCLDTNPESCSSKQARYQLSHPKVKFLSIEIQS